MERDAMVVAAMETIASGLPPLVRERLELFASRVTEAQLEATLFQMGARVSVGYLDSVLVGFLFGELAEMCVTLAETRVELDAHRAALAALGYELHEGDGEGM